MIALEVVQEIIERHRLRSDLFTLVSHPAGPGWRQRRRTVGQRLDDLRAGLAFERLPQTEVDGTTLLGATLRDLDGYRSDREHVVSISSRLAGPQGTRHLALMDLHLEEFVPLDRLEAAVHVLCDERRSWVLRTDRHYHLYGDFVLDERQWIRWNARFQMTLALVDARYVGYSLWRGCNLLRLNAASRFTTRVPASALAGPTPIAPDAARLAEDRHRCQLRKSGEPTVNHLREVAELAIAIWNEYVAQARQPVAEASPQELYACGYLHDCLEDTESDYEDVLAVAGPSVAAWVRALSIDKRLPVAQRRAEYERQLAAAAVPARIVKLADLLSNLRGIRGTEDVAWMRRYLDVVDRQLDVVGEGLGRLRHLDAARQLVGTWRRRARERPWHTADDAEN